MLRRTLLVFIAGWVLWFWIDKPPGGLAGLPRPADSMLENFQRAFDILKAGHLEVAWLYIWNAHYLVLSLLGGLLLSVITGAIADQLARRRLRRHFLPPRRADGDNPPQPVTASAEKESTGDQRVE